MARADLHIHTTASDGEHSPAEVVDLACQAGLAAIAITDHDTVDGIAAAQAAGRDAGLRVVSGVEISTDHRGAEVHILGYFIDSRDPELLAFLVDQRESRTERAHAVIDRLCALGFPVEFERVRELAGGAIGRPHIAAALLEAGHVTNIDMAMRNLLGRGGAAYVPRRKLAPQEAVAVVRRAEGAPVFAHPGISSREWLLPDLIGAGLMGIEAYHPQHTAAQQQRFAAIARAKGLVATGGSDFHGRMWSANVGVGGVSVAVGVLDELVTRLANA